ncbi:hypothetical protein ACHQM5_009940 [Ranunculus cassubicifolius]
MIICSSAQNYQVRETSSLDRNTPNEKQEIGSNHVLSEPMDVTTVSDLAEKSHTGENPVLDENTRGESGLPSGCVIGELVEARPAGSTAGQTLNLCEIEFGTGNVQCEPVESEVVGSDSTGDGELGMKTMIIDSAVHDNQTTGSSNLDQNTSERKVEAVSELGTAEPMDIVVEGIAEEKENKTGSSISQENTVAEKPELDSKLVLAEPTKPISVGSNAQNSQTLDSLEQIEGKPMETKIIGSDTVNVGLSSGMAIVGSISQNCTAGSLILESNTSDEKLKTDSEHVSSVHLDTRPVGSDAEGKSEGKPENDPKLVHNEAMETSTAECDAQKIQLFEVHLEQKNVPTENKIVGSEFVDAGFSGIGAAENSDFTGHKESTASSRSRKQKSALNCTPVTIRALRPRVNGLCKTPEPVSTSANANVSGEREKRKKKRKRTVNAVDDEFSRTRKRLRYFLSRMGYEHNFIEAYSGEGWKGQSAEKIRPEKELERAASQILQCKRRIRELFQNLDSSCAEGRFQESLFDADGLIDSDDIFCAKCGSKDVVADNDIILCDGICDRGFHQMCLTPPLLKEEIPPGDEGWLCPGCDCKLDCIDLLNDSQGTDLSMDDNWEKVFPEAAATVVDMLDEIAGLPSDDSEDNEYNPDASDGEDEVNTEGSSSGDSENSDDSQNSDDSENSDGSENSSGSAGLAVNSIDAQIMALPSDDSEDDNYDPNAPDLEQTKEDGSSSDSTSASAYFSASDASESSEAEDDTLPSSIDGSKLPARETRNSKMASSKSQSVNSELLEILESNSQGDSTPVLGKRLRERLDYKKLHDEEYGNVPSDSSDDEDYVDTDAPPQKKVNGIGGESSMLLKGNSETLARRDTMSRKRKSEETGSTSVRRTRMKKDPKIEGEMEIDSAGGLELTEKGTTPMTSKALGQDGKEKLQEAFKENDYPSRDTKEKLGKELGMTIKQVSKWFEYARMKAKRKGTTITKEDQTTPANEVGELNEKAGTTKEEETPGKHAVKAEEKTLANCAEAKDSKEEEKPPNKIEEVPEKQTSKRASRTKEKAPPGKDVVEPEEKILSNGVKAKETKEEEVPPSKVELGENADKALASKENATSKVVVETVSEVCTPKSLRSGRDVGATTPSSQTSKEDRALVLSLTAKNSQKSQVQTRSQKVAASSRVQTRSRKDGSKGK